MLAPVETLPPVKIDPYIRDYQPSAEGLEVWGCMDVRPPHQNDRVLGNDLYFQLGGADYGLGVVVATGMEIDRRNSFTRERVAVHTLGKQAAKVLLESGILVVLHDDCKAIIFGEKIANSAATESGDTLEHAIEFDPRVDYDAYDRSVDASRAFLRLGLIPETAHRTYQDMTADSPEHPAVPVATLEEAPTSQPQGFVAIHEADKAFDVEAADADGNNLYVVTPGSLENMHEALQPHFPVRLETLKKAIAIYTATIQTHHLLGPDGRPLPIYRYGEAAQQ